MHHGFSDVGDGTCVSVCVCVSVCGGGGMMIKVGIAI